MPNRKLVAPIIDNLPNKSVEPQYWSEHGKSGRPGVSSISVSEKPHKSYSAAVLRGKNVTLEVSGEKEMTMDDYEKMAESVGEAENELKQFRKMLQKKWSNLVRECEEADKELKKCEKKMEGSREKLAAVHNLTTTRKVADKLEKRKSVKLKKKSAEAASMDEKMVLELKEAASVFEKDERVLLKMRSNRLKLYNELEKCESLSMKLWLEAYTESESEEEQKKAQPKKVPAGFETAERGWYRYGCKDRFDISNLKLTEIHFEARSCDSSRAERAWGAEKNSDKQKKACGKVCSECDFPCVFEHPKDSVCPPHCPQYRMTALSAARCLSKGGPVEIGMSPKCPRFLILETSFRVAGECCVVVAIDTQVTGNMLPYINCWTNLFLPLVQWSLQANGFTDEAIADAFSRMHEITWDHVESQCCGRVPRIPMTARCPAYNAVVLAFWDGRFKLGGQTGQKVVIAGEPALEEAKFYDITYKGQAHGDLKVRIQEGDFSDCDAFFMVPLEMSQEKVLHIAQSTSLDVEDMALAFRGEDVWVARLNPRCLDSFPCYVLEM